MIVVMEIKNRRRPEDPFLQSVGTGHAEDARTEAAAAVTERGDRNCDSNCGSNCNNNYDSNCCINRNCHNNYQSNGGSNCCIKRNSCG